jgi:small subunit ribosomal protein S6
MGMSLYELTVILRQDVANSEIKKVSDELSHIIKEGGGKLLKEENWGLRYLSYPIKKNKKGYYLMMVFEAPSQVLNELQRIISLSEYIIRDLLVKMKSFDNKDSIMLKQMQQTRAEEYEIKKT